MAIGAAFLRFKSILASSQREGSRTHVCARNENVLFGAHKARGPTAFRTAWECNLRYTCGRCSPLRAYVAGDMTCRDNVALLPNRYIPKVVLITSSVSHKDGLRTPVTPTACDYSPVRFLVLRTLLGGVVVHWVGETLCPLDSCLFRRTQNSDCTLCRFSPQKISVGGRTKRPTLCKRPIPSLWPCWSPPSPLRLRHRSSALSSTRLGKRIAQLNTTGQRKLSPEPGPR